MRSVTFTQKILSTVLGAFTILGAAFLPLAAHAHVKWFVGSGVKMSPFELTESWVIIWIVALITIIVLGILYEKKYPPRKTTRKRWGKNVLRTFQVLVGAWLVVSAYEGHIFLPILEANTVTTQIMQGGLFISGVLIITGLLPALASILLGAVYVAACVEFGFGTMVEHFYILGIAFAYFTVTSSSKFWHKFATNSIPAMRITAGIALTVVAFNEKLLHPELANAFLQVHPWNFMQLLGITWFDDRLFILSAGMVELLVGLLYLTGVLTRLNTLALWTVFTTTAILLGPLEVIGHLPIIAISIVLFIYGPGRYRLSGSLFGKKNTRGRRSSNDTGAVYADDDADDE